MLSDLLANKYGVKNKPATSAGEDAGITTSKFTSGPSSVPPIKGGKPLEQSAKQGLTTLSISSCTAEAQNEDQWDGGKKQQQQRNVCTLLAKIPSRERIDARDVGEYF